MNEPRRLAEHADRPSKGREVCEPSVPPAKTTPVNKRRPLLRPVVCLLALAFIDAGFIRSSSGHAHGAEFAASANRAALDEVFRDGFENFEPPVEGHCTLSYRLDNSRFFIRDSALEMFDADIDGDGTSTGPLGGFVVLRTAAQGGAPADGTVEVLQYELVQSFTSSNILTELMDSSGDGTSPVATGILTTGATHSLAFSPCVLPAGTDVFNEDYTQSESFTPDDVGTGAGCLAPYRSVGTVTCNAGSFVCGLYNLNTGPNDRNETWEQPLNEITLSGDYLSLTMSQTGDYAQTIDGSGAIAIPNRTPSTTWMHWAGSLDEMVCD